MITKRWLNLSWVSRKELGGVVDSESEKDQWTVSTGGVKVQGTERQGVLNRERDAWGESRLVWSLN